MDAFYYDYRGSHSWAFLPKRTIEEKKDHARCADLFEHSESPEQVKISLPWRLSQGERPHRELEG